MDYEEKYKNLVKRLNKAREEKGVYTFNSVLDAVAPELKESEDERIKKELLNAFQEAEDSLYMVLTPNRRKSFIAWLEKQDVQKPSEKIEPKFKIGDWIICRNGEDALYQITDSIPTGYMIKGDDGIIHSVTFEQLVNCNATLSVIQNQKPAWSEEDERKLELLRALIEDTKGDSTSYSTMFIEMEELDNWLKSIKERYTWKPSDEQIITLEYYMHTLICNKHKEILFGLYTDLKKLKG